MIDCIESDKKIKISEKMNKSNTFLLYIYFLHSVVYLLIYLNVEKLK